MLQPIDDGPDVRGPGLALALFGLAVSLLAMVGWAFDVRVLYGFGIGDYPYWPLTVIGNAAIALGQMVSFAGRRSAGTLLLLLPMAIGALALGEYVGGPVFGIDGWLFPRAVADLGLVAPGRPSVLSALALVILSATSIVTTRSGRAQDLAILAMGCFSIGLGWLSIGLLSFGFAPPLADQPFRLSSSIPGAIVTVALTCSLFAYRSVADPQGLFGRRAVSSQAQRVSLPVLLMLPVALLPLHRALVEHRLATPFTAEVLALAIELAGAAALVALGIGRIARDRGALVESEARLAHALEAHSIGLFDWTIRTDTLHWSPGAEERMGLPVGSMTSLKSWSDLVLPEDAKRVMAIVADTIARQGDRYTFVYRICRPDGDVRTIEGSARCFYNRKGDLERIAGVNLDITDRIRREAEIARRETQWRSVLATVPDALIELDEAAVILSVSTAGERMFGYAAAEMIGRRVSMLMPLSRALEFDTLFAGTKASLGMLSLGAIHQHTALRKDGSEFPVETSVGEALIDGKPRFTAFIRDISDRRAAERRFAELQLEYAHSARLSAVGELSSGLAHELNQPLAAGANYLGTAELMLETANDVEDAREMITAAGAQMLRAGEIIRRLRDFVAKADVDMRVEPLDNLLREAVSLGLTGTRQRPIEVSYAIDDEARAIFADRIQIQQVVVNVVRNAAEALRLMPADRRTIAIASRPLDGDRLEVSIADRGPGLPPEMLQEMFAPFRSTKRGSGLGIGLSICHRIIEAHGGTLSAANRPGGGARIAFTLSRVTEDPAESGEPCVTSMS